MDRITEARGQVPLRNLAPLTTSHPFERRQTMAIPPEIQLLIAQVKQQYPQLAHLPDEVVAQMILQALREQQQSQTRIPTDEEELKRLPLEQIGAIGERMMNTGRWDEAEKVLFIGLQKAEEENDVPLQSKFLGIIARLCRDRGDFPQAMALAERIGDPHLMGVIYDQMGSTYFMQGGYPQAIEYYKKSLEIHADMGNEQDVAVEYGNLGNVYRQQGDYERAIQAHKKAIELNIKTGRESGAAKQYGNLGSVYFLQGQYDLVIETHQKGLEIFLRIGDQQGAASVYAILGDVHGRLGNYEQAIQIYQRALEIMQRIGDEPNAATIYGNLAAVYQEMGDVGQALAYYNQALKILERIGDWHNAAIFYFNLGLLYREQGDREQAHAYYEKAKALYEMLAEALWAQRAAQVLRRL